MDGSKPINRTPAEVTAQERARLLRLAYRFCWDASDAEDALHDALLVGVEKGHQLRDPAKRWPWLCRVVIQQCRLLGRKQRRERAVQGAAGFSPRGSSSTQDAPIAGSPRVTQPSEELDKAELGDLMRRLLVQLPAQQQAAVTLRHIERLDYPQIALIMAISESTVRAHVYAGRETLRSLIVARHPEWQL